MPAVFCFRETGFSGIPNHGEGAFDLLYNPVEFIYAIFKLYWAVVAFAEEAVTSCWCFWDSF